MTADLTAPQRSPWRGPAGPLAVFAFLAVLVPILSQRGQVLVFSLAGLVALVIHVRQHRLLWPAWRDSRFLRVGVVYVVWGLLSVIWSLDLRTSLGQGLELVGALFAFGVMMPVAAELSTVERRLVGMACVVGVLVNALVLLVDGYGGMPLQSLVRHGDPHPPAHMLNKALVTMALMVWPAALHLWQLGRRGCATLLLCAMTVVVGPLDSRTAALALVTGLLAALITRFTSRLALGVLAVCLVAGALSMPYVVEPMKAWFLAHMDMTTWWSAHHRLYIWSFVLDRMAERPFLGWGLEASRVMPDFGWIPWPGQDRMIPLHPHNEFLQVWMELGPLGLGLLLAGLLVPLRNALACAPGQRIFIAGAWTTTVVAMLPGYGAGQAWWLFTVLGLGVLFRAVLIAEDKT